MQRLSVVNNQERRWKKIKSDPEKYNELLRKKRISRRLHPRNSVLLNEYRKQLREVAKDIGNCPQCFRPKEKDKYKMCAKCREYSRKYYKKKKEAKQ